MLLHPNHSLDAVQEVTLQVAWAWPGLHPLAGTSELRDSVADQLRGLFLISLTAIFNAC